MNAAMTGKRVRDVVRVAAVVVLVAALFFAAGALLPDTSAVLMALGAFALPLLAHALVRGRGRASQTAEA